MIFECHCAAGLVRCALKDKGALVAIELWEVPEVAFGKLRQQIEALYAAAR